VRYVLEGSVRKAANRLRITGQLIDTATGAHLWADRFEGALEDIFDLQDQVTASVVWAIVPTLEKAEIERAKRKPTESLDAYDYFLRGMASFHQFASREANAEALRLFNRAIELDPEFASAYAMAAQCYMVRMASNWMNDPTDEIAEGQKLAQRAVELGKDDALVLASSGISLAYMARDLDTGAALSERALTLNTNLAAVWFFSGWIKIWLGEPDAAIGRLERAMRLSPLDAYVLRMQNAMSHAHFFAGHYDEAASWAAAMLRDFPDFHNGLRMSAASNALAGRLDLAQKSIARLRQLDPALRVSNLRDIQGPYRRPEEHEKYEQALRKAGLPE
jgi:adenylate cyclase